MTKACYIRLYLNNVGNNVMLEGLTYLHVFRIIKCSNDLYGN